MLAFVGLLLHLIKNQDKQNFKHLFAETKLFITDNKMTLEIETKIFCKKRWSLSENLQRIK
jgi:hypothetical protein